MSLFLNILYVTVYSLFVIVFASYFAGVLIRKALL